MKKPKNLCRSAELAPKLWDGVSTHLSAGEKWHLSRLIIKARTNKAFCELIEFADDDDLSNAFQWGNTPQGFDYWSSIYDRFVFGGEE